MRLLANYTEYTLKRTRPRFLPTRLLIEPTSHCNLMCPGCPSKDLPDRKRVHMEMGLFRKLADEASGFARDVHLFVAGEPLMHPDILEMVGYLKKKGLRAMIHTNGALLDTNLAQGLLEQKLDYLSFSLDGYDAKTAHRYKPPVDFDRVIANVVSLLELKKEMKATRPFTIIQSLLFNENDYPDELVAEFKARFKDLPLDRLHRIKPHDWAGQTHRKPSTTEKQAYKHCFRPWFSLAVLACGEIVPCCIDCTGKYVIGDATRISLEEAWRGKRLAELRAMLITGEKQAEKSGLCGGCHMLYTKRLFGLPLEEMGFFIKERSRKV